MVAPWSFQHWFLFINQRIASACVSFQIEKTAHVRWLVAHNQDVLFMHTKSDLVQIVTLKHKSFFTWAILYFLEIPSGRRNLATSQLLRIKNQGVPQTMWYSEILYFHLYLWAMTDKNIFMKMFLLLYFLNTSSPNIVQHVLHLLWKQIRCHWDKCTMLPFLADKGSVLPEAFYWNVHVKCQSKPLDRKCSVDVARQ